MSSPVETERIKKHLKIEESGLPEITADDEGGVLTVVDGKWAIVVPEAPQTEIM